MERAEPLRRAALLTLLLALPAACEKHEPDPPSREERVAQADSLFTPALFDTISWPSDSARAFEGNNTYAANCRSCHGYMGAGGTDYAAERNLPVPSLVRAEWPYDSVNDVRRRIFTGHPTGMPTWGVAGITPREIDAVSYYIVHVLRSEVLGR